LRLSFSAERVKNALTAWDIGNCADFQVVVASAEFYQNRLWVFDLEQGGFSMSLRKGAILGRAGLFGLLALIGIAGDGFAEPRGTIGLQGTFSDVFDRIDDDYRGGPGFNFFGAYHLSRSFDVRGDFGARFLDGEGTRLYTHKPTPDLRSQFGEATEEMRVMPFTVDLVYRLEQVSKGRFWVPYVALGAGLYDIQVTYLPSDSTSKIPHSHDEGGRPLTSLGGNELDDEFDKGRKQNIFDFGWNAKAGVNLHRTSGLFVNLEAGAHAINTRRRWTPMYDVSIGVGTILPLHVP